MIKKALIPAAGFGTRLLPATKSQPKEMLPIVDTPVIQYVVEEAVASGITDILMVIGKGKRAIEEHFDRNFELEHRLQERQKDALLAAIRKISNLANIHFIWQRELHGLGDAVRYGRDHMGKEPFAVLLGDTLMESHSPVPVIRQLMEVYAQHQAPVIALEQVDPALTFRYGVIGGKAIQDRMYRVEQLVEKPAPEAAPSNLVIAGRYILTPEIFEYLDAVKPGANDEIQLTDAMALMLRDHPIYALHFEGRRYDVGNKLDFIKTNLIYGLKRPELRPQLEEFIRDLRQTLS